MKTLGTLALLALAACSGDDEKSGGDSAAPADSGAGGDSAATADSGDSGAADSGGAEGGSDGGADGGEGGSSDFPADPTPFTLSYSGADSGSLVFDEVQCTWPPGSSNLRVGWRNASDEHVFVLLIDLLGVFDGVGSYSSDESSNVRARLQEEAGGSGANFVVDSAQGDLVSITVEGADQEAGQVWGSFDVATMHDLSGGMISLDPGTFPIWCPSIND
jgi:hypothetical protein